METFIILSIVFLSIVVLAYKILKGLKGDSCCCGSGDAKNKYCDGCKKNK